MQRDGHVQQEFGEFLLHFLNLVPGSTGIISDTRSIMLLFYRKYIRTWDSEEQVLNPKQRFKLTIAKFTSLEIKYRFSIVCESVVVSRVGGNSAGNLTSSPSTPTLTNALLVE